MSINLKFNMNSSTLQVIQTFISNKGEDFMEEIGNLWTYATVSSNKKSLHLLPRILKCLLPENKKKFVELKTFYANSMVKTFLYKHKYASNHKYFVIIDQCSIFFNLLASGLGSLFF